MTWRALLFVVGLFGTTITLVSNVDAFIKVARWMRYLTEAWKIYTHRVWEFVFGWIGLHPPPFIKNMLTFLVFFWMVFVGSILHTVVAVRFGFQREPTTGDVSQWEVARNFLSVCLGVSLAYLLIVADSWDAASAYFYRLLIGVPPCLFFLPKSFGFNFVLEQVRNRLIVIWLLVAAVIALGLATNFEWWLKKI